MIIIMMFSLKQINGWFYDLSNQVLVIKNKKEGVIEDDRKYYIFLS